MRARIPILPLLPMFALGAPAAAAGAEQPPAAAPALSISTPAGVVDANHLQQVTNVHSATNPQRLVRAAVKALESCQSLSAEISHEVDLYGKRLIGSGVYFEQHHEPARLVRLELRLPLGDKTSSLVQVCDGRYLWTYRQLLDQGNLSRLDVAQAAAAVREAERLGKQKSMSALPGLGGLPKLLRGLDATFDFTSAQRGILRLRDDRLPVWRLRGEWKPALLAKILPDQQEVIEAGEPPDWSELPEHLPEYVLLMLGHDDLFPYRLEYHRTAASGDAPVADRAMVTMQLYEVVRDAPISPHRFQYNPGGLGFEDETEKFLESLEAAQ